MQKHILYTKIKNSHTIHTNFLPSPGVVILFEINQNTRAHGCHRYRNIKMKRKFKVLQKPK